MGWFERPLSEISLVVRLLSLLFGLGEVVTVHKLSENVPRFFGQDSLPQLPSKATDPLKNRELDQPGGMLYINLPYIQDNTVLKQI